ncbi:DUF4870 domain-containing protein [Tenacibaculum jejuense]|uniref:tRNA modification GTPase n=1 Tax=Tenacibaculum jejuense TaxID=584609 RepID=A0A238UCP0_9FLAO|nr:DUF4870 domain-containing protein [Tenacibaculum jejuense]SNR16234.1 Probable transmembrane protein of unknown function [Tenacibaculum jejuense]
MQRNKELLAITHLSQLLDLLTVIGGFVTPLIIWILKKDEVEGMDEHGKSILNFRISMFIYALLCVPLILFFGLGILGLIFLGIIYFIFPIINAIKATNGEAPNYPLSIRFLE